MDLGPDGNKALLTYARRAWDDAVAPDGQLHFSHEHSVKMWALTDPQLQFDRVMFDEAQDANEVLAGVLQGQRAQVIVVGDENQAIYGFRGASDQLRRWDADARLPLTQSWRFGAAVADAGNRFLQLLGAEQRVQGNPGKASRVEEDMADPDAVLCRTNAGAVGAVIANLDAGRRVALAGGGGDIEALARAARDLQAGRSTTHPELAHFDSWSAVREFAENDPEGKSLQALVRLVDSYGPDGLLGLVAKLTPEGSPAGVDVVVSTAHKAKGREWPRVQIAGDFPVPKEQNGVESCRTRRAAPGLRGGDPRREVLDPGSLGWVYGRTDASGGEPGAPHSPAPAVPGPSTVTVDRGESS